MKIDKLTYHNLIEVTNHISGNHSLGISGVSGSGKTSFCQAIHHEAIRRIVSLLPRSEYLFLFPESVTVIPGALGLKDLPLFKFLTKSAADSSPRSTIGTHSGVFREVRQAFAHAHGQASQFFSFNHHLMWCEKCKGRGVFGGKICPECIGGRYRREADQYPLSLDNGIFTIEAVNSTPVASLSRLLGEGILSETSRKFLATMTALDAGYLSLGRTVSTLSGGELTRLYLSEFINSSEGAVIVIDEISHGLDSKLLLDTLEHLRDLGMRNQLWLIDHSRKVLNSMQCSLKFGPGSGANGGRIVDSNIDIESVAPRPLSVNTDNLYSLKNLRCRNINIRTFEFPCNSLVAITGVSGSGKSTLINECVAKQFPLQYPKHRLVTVAQARTQSITSRSTIASFLGVADAIKKLPAEGKGKKSFSCVECGGDGVADDGLPCIFCNGTGMNDSVVKIGKDKIPVRQIYSHTLDDVGALLKPADGGENTLGMLVRLGVGHLNLARRVNTLSTGEFQCLHLVQALTTLDPAVPTLLTLDEPTHGLSQNIVNHLLEMLFDALRQFDLSVLAIEHHSFFLEQCQFEIALGEYRRDDIAQLICQPMRRERLNEEIQSKISLLPSRLPQRRGIHEIDDERLAKEIFAKAENDFFGGVLRPLSRKAGWIYSACEAGSSSRSVVAMNLERGGIYSKSTSLFDLCGIGDHIVADMAHTPAEFSLFDYKNKRLHCRGCKGSGKYETFDYRILFHDEKSGFWDELLKKNIVDMLRSYNFSKVRFLFNNVKKKFGFDLAAPFSMMDEQTRQAFLYGIWNHSFFEPAKQTYREWRGLVFLARKYVQGIDSSIVRDIRESKDWIICPNCHGDILRHDRTLLKNGIDIRAIRRMPLSEAVSLFPSITALKAVTNAIGEDLTLSTDVSDLDRNAQKKLKLLELEQASLAGFEIAIKGLDAGDPDVRDSLSMLATRNLIQLCGKPRESRESSVILEELLSTGITADTFLWEALSVKSPMSRLRKMRKQYPCKACGGKGVFTTDAVDDGIDKYTELCSVCNGSGLAPASLKKIVDGVQLGDLTVGGKAVFAVTDDVPDELMYVLPDTPVSELTLVQLKVLKKAAVSPKKGERHRK